MEPAATPAAKRSKQDELVTPQPRERSPTLFGVSKGDEGAIALDDPTGLLGDSDDDIQFSQTDNPVWGSDALSGQQYKQGKTLHDRIHGHIFLEPVVVAIMDTAEFQRLRELKQLGGTSFVYPSACHSRFEHCVGVAHLADVAVKHLMQQDDGRLGITEQDRLCVKLAGLCHDLGHGPFSHTFEHFVNTARSARGKPAWEHEDASLALLDYLLVTNAIDLESYGLNPDVDVPFIKLLISGIPPTAEWPARKVGRPKDKRFLSEIVANKRNGLDVDKFDYFVRDSICAMGAPPIVCDVARIIRSMRVCTVDGDPQICFEQKLVLQLLDLFKLRSWLHKFVYQHHTVNVVEEMICDVLHMADEHMVLASSKDTCSLRLSDTVEDIAAFGKIGDWILNAIEASTDVRLHPAQALLLRLRQRDLYSQVGQPMHMHSTKLFRMRGDEVRECILQCLPPHADHLQCAKDLLVHFTVIDFGSRTLDGTPDNPIDKVCFFNPKQNPNTAGRLQRSLPDMLLPRSFHEKLLYVYSRRDESYEALEAAFRSWKVKLRSRPARNGSTTVDLTPVATGNQPSPRKAAARLERKKSHALQRERTAETLRRVCSK